MYHICFTSLRREGPNQYPSQEQRWIYFSLNILFQNNQFWFVSLFVGGQAYYIAAVHYHHNSTTPGNFLRISLKTFTTSLTNDQTSWSEAEEQTVYLKEEKRDEIQIVEFDGAMTNNFYFTLNGVNPR